MPVRFKMTVAYDGANYAGWQIQPDAVTVQSELERVIGEITGEIVKVHGSGRTDSGVHGRAQIAHVDLTHEVNLNRLMLGLNALLDADIRVSEIVPVAADFHARRSAVGKQYRYFIWDGPVLPPFLRLYRCHCRRGLSVEAMQEAASQLTGRHDFAAFAANPNRDVPSTVRTLSRLDVTREDREICIVAESEGFLYKMVRSLTGLLIRVGQGEVPPGVAREILASRVRTARVPTAQPQGLFLWEVYY